MTVSKKKTANRYVYERAEKVLDEFVATMEGEQFRRAYRKFKLAIVLYAHCDYLGATTNAVEGPVTRDQALAWAWEDADIAFRGYGEEALTGFILQMWTHVPHGEEGALRKAIKKAFKAADAATPLGVQRRYLLRWRGKKVRDLDRGFDLPSVIPCMGIKLREWAADLGEEAEAISEQLEWMAASECESETVAKVRKRVTRSRMDTSAARGYLRVLDGGDDEVPNAQ